MLYSRNLLFIYFYLKWLVSANLKLLIYKISFKHIMWCNILEQTLEMFINQNFLQDIIYFLFSQCSLHIELPYAFFFFRCEVVCCLPLRPSHNLFIYSHPGLLPRVSCLSSYFTYKRAFVFFNLEQLLIKVALLILWITPKLWVIKLVHRQVYGLWLTKCIAETAIRHLTF